MADPAGAPALPTISDPALCVLRKLFTNWDQLGSATQGTVYARVQGQVNNPLLQEQFGCLTIGGAASQAIASNVPDVVAGAVGFVFSAIGHFATNFSSSMISGLGKVNQAYIVGLLVAAMVVFVLLGGPG